jgi:hypothetical protein
MAARDFFEAGLPDEGVYRFTIDKMQVREFTSQTTGEKYKKMIGSFVLEEDSLGSYEPRNKDRVSESFPLYGKSLRRLANLFKAVTGRTPVVTVNEDGDEVIDFDAMADELNGGSAWGPLMHRKRQQRQEDGTYEDTDETDAKFGWSFAEKPDAVRVPQDLATKLGL